MIAAPYDQSDSAEWGCTTEKVIGAEGTAVGTGRQNTLDIVNSCDSLDIAARICNDLTLNGYDDWFLPSKDELYLMYLKQEIIGNFSSVDPSPYWSSSEYEIHFAAWRQVFTDGEQTIYDKYNKYFVRAIRSF